MFDDLPYDFVGTFYCYNFAIGEFIAFDGQSYQSSLLVPTLQACGAWVDMQQA